MSAILSYFHEIWKLVIDGQTGKQWSEAPCVDISFSCFYFPVNKWYGKKKRTLSHQIKGLVGHSHLGWIGDIREILDTKCDMQFHR